MTETLSALLERVEKAEGPDREIDARIWKALNPDQQVLFDGGDVRTRRQAEYGRLADFPLEGFDDWEGIAGHIGAPLLTASIDAALATAERIHPGRRVVMERGQSYASARIVRGWGGRRETGPVSERGDDELPLAIIAAALRALIALSPTERDARAMAGEG